MGCANLNKTLSTLANKKAKLREKQQASGMVQQENPWRFRKKAFTNLKKQRELNFVMNSKRRRKRSKNKSKKNKKSKCSDI